MPKSGARTHRWEPKVTLYIDSPDFTPPGSTADRTDAFNRAIEQTPNLASLIASLPPLPTDRRPAIVVRKDGSGRHGIEISQRTKTAKLLRIGRKGRVRGRMRAGRWSRLARVQ